MSRPIAVTVGPLATADPDGVSTAQAAAGAQYLALNGALTNGTTANNVCQSQTPSGAGALTLNGTLVSGGVAYLGGNQRIYITSASDISNRTFTITGFAQGLQGSSPLVSVTEVLTGPNASIVASQKQYYSISSIVISGAAAGALTIGRAGFATMDNQRRVAIDSDGNDSGIAFTIVGTDGSGSAISEVLTGANAGVATSVLSYKTVTSVLTSGAVATTVEVGSSAVADSQWVPFDSYAATAPTAIQCTADGTVNYTVQQTLDNPTSFDNLLVYNDPSGVTWVDHPTSALVGATGTVQGNYAYAPAFAKVVLNSGTGSVTATFIQAYTW